MKPRAIFGLMLLAALAIGLGLEAEPGGAGIEAIGPEIKVQLNLAPLAVSAAGAEVQKLDDYRVRLTCKSGNLSLPLAPNEAIYGLSERIVDNFASSEEFPQAVGGLNLRGQRFTMWVTPTISAYAPFYLSSRGYGLLVEGTRPGIYDLGKTDPNRLTLSWDIGDKPLSVVFFSGPSYLEILDRYTAMTGRPVLPPKWAFRPWKWRDECRPLRFADLDGVTVNAEVADDIRNYQQLGFPPGVYLVDRPWAEGEMGWGNLTWDPNRFPHGDEMVKKLNARGWQVVVWGAPWAIGRTARDFGPEAQAKGYKVGDRELDYTNPEAVAWHQEKIKAFLARSGVAGWKLDRGEETNPSTKKDIYHDGRTGFEVHNDYPRMYIKTYYDAARAVRGDDFVLMARPAYTGTTAWSVVWGGDTRGSVRVMGIPRSTDKGLRSTLISLQRMAFIGYPVWGSDTGGYQGFRHRDVFARWVEFSAFCPLMEIGGVGPHEPWAMPASPRYDEEMIRIVRRYTWLHTRLLDYTYALAQKAHETGDPIVHPLVFDWPDDPKAADRWDEFLYGPALLVAPIWETGKRERAVYLPQGEWIDLWDRDKKFTGPTEITVAVPLDRIPVFVRAEKAEMLPAGLLEGL